MKLFKLIALIIALATSCASYSTYTLYERMKQKFAAARMLAAYAIQEWGAKKTTPKQSNQEPSEEQKEAIAHLIKSIQAHEKEIKELEITRLHGPFLY